MSTVDDAIDAHGRDGDGRRRRVRAARPSAAQTVRALVDTAFVLAFAALAAFAIWPVYAGGYLFITLGGAALVGAGAAYVGIRLRWSWLGVVLVAVGAYLVLGVPLAIPSAFRSRADLIDGYRQLVAASVFGWKQLITIVLPVGHYQALLVPALMVALACATAAFSLVWRRSRAVPVVVPIMLLPVVFGISFGTSALTAPLAFGSWNLDAPRELLVGVLGALLGGGYLLWNAARSRAEALRIARQATGVRRAERGGAGRIRRTVTAVVVVVIAVVVSVGATSAFLTPSDKQVLRTAVVPTQKLLQYPSPLGDYRASFAGTAYSQKLLTVTGDLKAVPRLRLSTLSSYDGQQFTVMSTVPGDASTAFARIPQLAGGRGSSGGAQLTVTVDGYRGVWLPTAAGLTAVGFSGTTRNALTDGFYYNAQTQAGVELAGLGGGDSYTLTADAAGTAGSTANATAADAAAALADARAPSAHPSQAYIPGSLSDWVKAQNLPDSGAGLAELITRLRARGYLSHSLEVPTATPNWLTDLGETAGSFQAAPAGESEDRIGAMFSALLTKQQSTASTANADLVAAVGDDEQFSTAAALLARYLGFPSRVVLGFALDDSARDADALPACAAGVCEGRNLTAWVEIQDAAGDWIPVDTTPQHTAPVHPADTKQRDPEHSTSVLPQHAQELQPPEANPSGNDQHSAKPHREQRDAAAFLKPLARIGGSILLLLLVLAAPFASILAVKAARRRERRRAASTAERMAGGWDDLVDSAVDLGLPRPGVRTRGETATLYAAAVRTADAGALRTLASGADEAVFGAFEPSGEASDAYWRSLETQRERMAAAFPRRRRWLALLSLRSFGGRAQLARRRRTVVMMRETEASRGAGSERRTDA